MTPYDSPEATYALGGELAAELRSSDILLLYGELGAGKTLLTKGIMEGLGYDVDEVTSPSFALVNLYQTAAFNVYHIDLWRLDTAQDIPAAVGMDEMLEEENSVLIIEWADRLGHTVLPGRTIRITLAGSGDGPRTIKVERPDETERSLQI